MTQTPNAPITYNNLMFTGDLAVVLLDSNGEMVSGWVTDGDPARKGMGAATYKGVAVPTLTIAPAILDQPKAATRKVGDTAAFTVYAEGSGALGYQWHKNGAVISDATSNIYTTPTLASGDNGNTYTCTVTNKYGAVTSTSGTLTIAASAAPTITSQPVSVSTTVGRTQVFHVVASGPGPISYQWQQNTGSGWTDIAGATSTDYVTGVLIQYCPGL